jgi:hypothetical protein
MHRTSIMIEYEGSLVSDTNRKKNATAANIIRGFGWSKRVTLLGYMALNVRLAVPGKCSIFNTQYSTLN